MLVCVLKLRKRSGRIQTNWEFTGSKVGRVNGDFSFNGNVLLITRRVFTYNLTNKKVNLKNFKCMIKTMMLAPDGEKNN